MNIYNGIIGYQLNEKINHTNTKFKDLFYIQLNISKDIYILILDREGYQINIDSNISSTDDYYFFVKIMTKSFKKTINFDDFHVFDLNDLFSDIKNHDDILKFVSVFQKLFSENIELNTIIDRQYKAFNSFNAFIRTTIDEINQKFEPLKFEYDRMADEIDLLLQNRQDPYIPSKIIDKKTDFGLKIIDIGNKINKNCFTFITDNLSKLKFKMERLCREIKSLNDEINEIIDIMPSSSLDFINLEFINKIINICSDLTDDKLSELQKYTKAIDKKYTSQLIQLKKNNDIHKEGIDVNRTRFERFVSIERLIRNIRADILTNLNILSVFKKPIKMINILPKLPQIYRWISIEHRVREIMIIKTLKKAIKYQQMLNELHEKEIMRRKDICDKLGIKDITSIFLHDPIYFKIKLVNMEHFPEFIVDEIPDDENFADLVNIINKKNKKYTSFEYYLDKFQKVVKNKKKLMSFSTISKILKDQGEQLIRLTKQIQSERTNSQRFSRSFMRNSQSQSQYFSKSFSRTTNSQISACSQTIEISRRSIGNQTLVISQKYENSIQQTEPEEIQNKKIKINYFWLIAIFVNIFFVFFRWI